MKKKGRLHCHWVPTSLSTLLLLLLLLARTLKLQNVETQSNNFMFDFPYPDSSQMVGVLYSRFWDPTKSKNFQSCRQFWELFMILFFKARKTIVG